MKKNGNFDKNSTFCPENGKKVDKIVTGRNFPCFGEGCMNQPLIYHNYSRLVSLGGEVVSMTGSFYGTYDLDADLSKDVENNSYFSVSWIKNQSTGSWVFSQKLKTSSKYPWLMLYLRADATSGFNGGYHYTSRGIMKKVHFSSISCLENSKEWHLISNVPQMIIIFIIIFLVSYLRVQTLRLN